MKSKVWWVGVMCLVLVACLVVNAEEAKKRVVTVTGAVSVDRDDDDKVTSVKITADDGVYNVVLNAAGKKLADMDGKTVEAKGRVRTKDEETWLRVSAFKEVKAEEEADEGE